MEFENVIQLIQTVSESNLTEFQMEEDGFKIKIKTDKGQKVITTQVPNITAVQEAPAQAAAPAHVQIDSPEKQISGNIVKSPLVGTYYSAPSPEDDPYVKVGDKVRKGQTLGIVEAMKLMNEIECEYDGTVKEILVHNEDKVEYGQTLFIIE